MYVRNAWYVACTADEIASSPLGRTVCGNRMVLFRSEGGAVAALEDHLKMAQSTESAVKANKTASR